MDKKTIKEIQNLQNDITQNASQLKSQQYVFEQKLRGSMGREMIESFENQKFLQEEVSKKECFLKKLLNITK